MRLVLAIVIFVQIFCRNGVLSRPQGNPTSLPANANAFQDALQNGVDLPGNLQNSLQNLQNATTNGVDLPNLPQVLGGASVQTPNSQNPLPTVQNNIPSQVSSLPSEVQNLARNLTNIPSNLAQAAQNIPANLAQNLPNFNQGGQRLLPSNLGQNLSPQLSNLTSVLPNIASSLQRNIAQARETISQNLPQSSLLNPQNLTSLLPNPQTGLGQLPSLNQEGPLQQVSNSVPQLSSSIPQFSNSLPQLSSSLPQLSSSLPQFSSSLPQLSSSLPQLSNSFPQLSSSLPILPAGQTASSSSILPNQSPSNSSLMNIDLDEEIGSQVSTQQGGQANNPSTVVKGKNRPVLPQMPQFIQPGGLLGNLQHFTEGQLQTTRDALRGTARNLLELHKLRNTEKRLLRQQQRLGLLGGNGGLGSSGLGLLSGSPLDISSSNQASNETSPLSGGISGGLLGQTSQAGFGLPNLGGGLLGIGRR